MESDEQLRAEIQYIFDSGANEVRVFEMAKGLLSRRTHHPTKPLTKLADNPDHCRQVWECVTGMAHIGSEEPLSISAHEENNFFGRNKEYVIIQQEFDRITIWSTGNFDFRLDESETSLTPSPWWHF